MFIIYIGSIASNLISFYPMETTKTESVIGYKAFNNDMTCENDFQYEVGKTYTMDDEIELCKSGFHFCMVPFEVLDYYDKYSKFAIIKASGKIIHDYDKSVCSCITIEKLISLDELCNFNGKFVRINNTIEYYQNGKYHRDNGPAIEYANGAKEWWKNGDLHREDGPAIERANGEKEWRKNGLLHREDGPAIEFANGDKEWYIKGYLHREDGPAIERANGDKEWYKNGEFHREDDPAIDYAD